MSTAFQTPPRPSSFQPFQDIKRRLADCDTAAAHEPETARVDVSDLVAEGRTIPKLQVNNSGSRINVVEAFNAIMDNLLLAIGLLSEKDNRTATISVSLLQRLVKYADKLQAVGDQLLSEAACSLLIHFPKSKFDDIQQLESEMFRIVSRLGALKPDQDVIAYKPSDVERRYLLSRRCRKMFTSTFGDDTDFRWLPDVLIVRSLSLSEMGLQGWAGYRHVVMLRESAGNDPDPSRLLQWLTIYMHERYHVEALLCSHNMNISTPEDILFRERHREPIRIGKGCERGVVGDVLLFGKNIDMQFDDEEAERILSEWEAEEDGWSPEARHLINKSPEGEVSYFCVSGRRPSRSGPL